MPQQKAANIRWHRGKISKEDRIKAMKQKGVVIWLTGLSGAGKSTIAVELEHALFENGHQTYILDGDNIRHGLNKDIGFSPEDRSENIRRIAEVAKLFIEANIITITAFISPYRQDRESARKLQKDGEFIEILEMTLEGFKEHVRNGGIHELGGCYAVLDYLGELK